MSRLARGIVAGLLAILLGGVLWGCDNPMCTRMNDCCEAIQGVEGVGRACGDIARQLDDADSCRSVLEAVRAMYDTRDETPPKACVAETSSRSSD